MTATRLAWLALCAACAGCTAAGRQGAAGDLTASADEPRAFGHHVGDLVSRQVTVKVPPGLALDDASLPQPGRHGQSFELRLVDWQRGSGPGHFTLRLVYQLFRSPAEVRTLELPPLTLHFVGQPRAQDLRIDAWPVVVSPLVPVDVSPRRGLGPLQPDALPLPIDTAQPRRRLLGAGLAVLLALAYLAHVYLALPWLARRQRPFERAWRALRTAPGVVSHAAVLAAYQQLHQALNRSAGRTLLEQGIDGFLAAQPRYAPLRDELVQFFQSSRQLFFGAGSLPALPARLQWLRALCQRCRDAERGAA